MCQICNVASQVENLIENRFLSKLLEEDTNSGIEDEPKDAEEEKKCTSCHDNVTATSWCVECEEFICQNCVMVIISYILNDIHVLYNYIFICSKSCHSLFSLRIGKWEMRNINSCWMKLFSGTSEIEDNQGSYD